MSALVSHSASRMTSGARRASGCMRLAWRFDILFAVTRSEPEMIMRPWRIIPVPKSPSLNEVDMSSSSSNFWASG